MKMVVYCIAVTFALSIKRLANDNFSLFHRKIQREKVVKPTGESKSGQWTNYNTFLILMGKLRKSLQLLTDNKFGRKNFQKYYVHYAKHILNPRMDREIPPIGVKSHFYTFDIDT